MITEEIQIPVISSEWSLSSSKLLSNGPVALSEVLVAETVLAGVAAGRGSSIFKIIDGRELGVERLKIGNNDNI